MKCLLTIQLITTLNLLLLMIAQSLRWMMTLLTLLTLAHKASTFRQSHASKMSSVSFLAKVQVVFQCGVFSQINDKQKIFLVEQSSTIAMVKGHQIHECYMVQDQN